MTIGQVRGLDSPMSDDQLSLLDRQQKQLARLVEIGCRMADRLDPWSQQEDMKATAQAKMQSFARLTDAMRKLMALEEYVSGIRDKRFKFVRSHWMEGRGTAVRQSVEQALTVSKPDLERKKRENLLGDLFRDYNIASVRGRALARLRRRDLRDARRHRRPVDLGRAGR
jgi:hypothetical protein